MTDEYNKHVMKKKRAAFRFYYGFDCIIDYLSLTIPNE